MNDYNSINNEESNISEIDSIRTNSGIGYNENSLLDELEILSINYFTSTERLKLYNKKLQDSFEQLDSISNQILIIENDNSNLEKSIKKVSITQQSLQLNTDNELKLENELKDKFTQLEYTLDEVNLKRNENSKNYFNRLADFQLFIEFYSNPLNINERRNIIKLKSQEESLSYLKCLYMKIGQNETLQNKLESDYENYKKQLIDLEEENKKKKIEIDLYNNKINKLDSGYYDEDNELLLLQKKIDETKKKLINNLDNATHNINNNSHINNNSNNNRNINRPNPFSFINNNNKQTQKSNIGILKPTLPISKQIVNNPSLPQPQMSLTLKPPIRNSNNFTNNSSITNIGNTNEQKSTSDKIGPIQRNFINTNK